MTDKRNKPIDAGRFGQTQDKPSPASGVDHASGWRKKSQADAKGGSLRGMPKDYEGNRIESPSAADRIPSEPINIPEENRSHHKTDPIAEGFGSMFNSALNSVKTHFWWPQSLPESALREQRDVPDKATSVQPKDDVIEMHVIGSVSDVSHLDNNTMSSGHRDNIDTKRSETQENTDAAQENRANHYSETPRDLAKPVVEGPKTFEQSLHYALTGMDHKTHLENALEKLNTCINDLDLANKKDERKGRTPGETVPLEQPEPDPSPFVWTQKICSKALEIINNAHKNYLNYDRSRESELKQILNDHPKEKDYVINSFDTFEAIYNDRNHELEKKPLGTSYETALRTTNVQAFRDLNRGFSNLNLAQNQDIPDDKLETLKARITGLRNKLIPNYNLLFEAKQNQLLNELKEKKKLPQGDNGQPPEAAQTSSGEQQ